jgi:hypothetical protein
LILSGVLFLAYLNAQFNSILCELDNYSAIIVVDYKMQILPALLEKQKVNSLWTLHTTLVFQKKNKNNHDELDVQAYDYWSADTK